MRSLIATVTLLFTMSAMAMPKYLEGAKVTVTLKNGKTYTYESEEMAVVPRENLGVNALKVAGFDTLHKKIVNKELVKNKKNRVYGLIGYGLNGEQDTEKNGDISSVKAGKGGILGAGYMRDINEDINVGIQIQTNGSAGLTIGTDF